MILDRFLRASTPMLALLPLTALVLLAPGVAHADEAAPVAAPPGKSWVRVGNFVPEMAATRVELQPLDRSGETITIAGDAVYGDVTAYDSILPGRYTATVSASGATSAAAPMLSRSFEVSANDARTVAVLGTPEAPRLALLTDDLTPPPAGSARIRLLSASAAAGAVTVVALGGPTIAAGAVLGQATEYATVPAGSWTLELQSDMDTATSRAVPVSSGSVYTVVVLDAADDKLRIDLVTDAAGAVVAPQGGAETGRGGAAPDHDSPWPYGALAVLAAVTATWLVRLRRRDGRA